MFFIGIFGVDSKVVPVGEISGQVCPICKKTVNMHVCLRYSYFHAFFLPLVKYDKHYIATCPGCASVFELPREIGDRLKRHESVAVNPHDLLLLKSNHIPACPVCGAPQTEGSVFCNKCGAKL